MDERLTISDIEQSTTDSFKNELQISNLQIDASLGVKRSNFRARNKKNFILSFDDRYILNDLGFHLIIDNMTSFYKQIKVLI